MIARAPGKLVLSGAYAVLEGAPALVTAVDRYVTADAGRAAARVTEEVAAAIAAGALGAAPWFDASALRAPVEGGGTRKLGLGSSAAILVASLAAARASEGHDKARLRELVFAPALAAHRAAQGGGSGVDVAASTFGGVLALHLEHGVLRHERHRLPPSIEIHVFASALSASTAALVGAVRAFATRRPGDHRARIDALSTASSAALAASDPTSFVEALRAQFAELHALGVDAEVPIVPPDQLALAALAASGGGAFGPSGAGGGDVSIHVAAGPPSASFLRAARAAGLEHTALTTGARGVHLA